MGTWATGDAEEGGGCTYTRWIDTGVSCDGVESTLGDDAHTPGQVTPMRAQQPHVKVMRPAKAHMVNTNTVAKHGGRLRIKSTRRSIPYRGEEEVLEEERSHSMPDISTHRVFGSPHRANRYSYGCAWAGKSPWACSSIR